MFYARLFAQHPELEQHFRNTSIQHQAAILTMELSVIEAFYVRKSEAAGMYLQLLGTKHKGRGIPEEAYPHFRDALLESLEQFHGADWSENLACEWGKSIDLSIKKMMEGYGQRFHV
jgi:hemoglobin-like flavoprotein